MASAQWRLLAAGVDWSSIQHELNVWEISDLLREASVAELDRIHWLIATSPLETAVVISRYQSLEQAHRKAEGLFDFMDRIAAQKRAREALN